MSQRGSIRKREFKDGATWTAYWRTPDGVQRSKGGFTTKREAQRHLTEVLGALQNGTYCEPSKKTVADYLQDEWLPSLERSANTLASYRGAVEGWIVPGLGGVPLSQLTPVRVKAFYASMRGAPRRDGLGIIGPRTPSLVSTVLVKALNDAVDSELIARNPANRVKRPALPRPEMHYWEPIQLRAFLAHVEGERLYPAFRLAAATGMRRGELLGLRWADLDLDAARLSIRQSLVVVGHTPQVNKPKTQMSRRPIDLDAATVGALRRWSLRQKQERLAWGEGWADTGLVFTREDGSWINPQVVTATFKRLAKRAGLPFIPLHGLRHSWATAALAAGVHPKVVQERLGHSTIAMTLDTYSHVVPGMGKDAAETVARLILGESG